MVKKAGMMEIAFTNGIVKADAKAMMLDLKDIEKMGMMMAGVEDIHYFYKRLDKFLDNKDTKEFIMELHKQKFSRAEKDSGENSTALSILVDKTIALDSYEENQYRHIINRTGRGRHSKAWGNLFLAIKYAMYVNKELEIEVIDTFINKKILDFRCLGIDYHKELNAKIDTLEDRVDKDNKFIYINSSKMISERIKGQFEKGWDNENNDAEITEQRTKLINNLIFMMDNKFIKNWEELKDQIVNCLIR